MRTPCMFVAVVFLTLTAPSMGRDLPSVTVRADDARITESCRIVIPPGTVIADASGDGVILIVASNITVEFAPGSELRGAPAGKSPDEYAGFGIRIIGQSNVTICGARLHGFLCGLHASRADGLVVEDVRVSDIRRQHLGSTPAAEDSADWLWPHENDQQEWLRKYGAALCIEDSRDVTVRRCRVRDSQNGLILDRVRESKVYDNDFSFLAGWGLAMWRSTKNVVSRNALDFCIRGYSHNVYNRGQDSAGILFFEQNCDNVIAENSATHGGDGFFGFAGRDALGEKWLDQERERLRRETGQQDVDKLIQVDDSIATGFKRKGCNDNLLINNDFSYAAAHGIELTFSFGNSLFGNRLIGNAICGVWGGYSQDTLIAGNVIAENGERGYGLERGGVNIEHGRNNQVVHNEFRANRCGVHLWGGPNGDFDQRPWGKANGSGATKNLIAGNTFDGDELAFHFRGPGDVTIGRNELKGIKQEISGEPAHRVVNDDDPPAPALNPPVYPVYGETRPVGARQALAGREHIIMTEWGPWDHESPLVRLVQTGARTHVYELRQLPADVQVELTGAGLMGKREPAVDHLRFKVEAPGPGVYPYRLAVMAGTVERRIAGVIVVASWSATFFPWSIDPREDLAGWRKLANGPDARRVDMDRLTVKFANGGPPVDDARIGSDHFGLVAQTRIPLTKGQWRLRTLSDDGVRVLADGRPVIENWTWHGPTADTGVLELEADRTVEFVVEYFEIDGYAVLEFELSRAATAGR